MSAAPRPGSCTTCGQPVPSWSAGGLCPRCLIKGGLTPLGERQPIEPPEIPDLQPLLENYDIHRLLGHGGMGAVYHATQRALDREVALKILPIDEERDPEGVERFRVEAKALARLSHPNIVAVHDFGEAGPYFYIVMEFVEGSDLAEAVDQGHIEPAHALRITSQLCGALQYAHSQGVVHRDLKPANIFIDRKGQVKVGDFGLAKVVGAEESKMLTEQGDRLGTPLYMAPEQRSAHAQVDHRADIYSLGIIFYELLTGELPSGTFPLPSECVDVDERVDEVVTKSTQSDPERRYRQASEMQSSVETIRSSPAGAPDRGGPRRQVLLAAGVLLLLGGAIWTFTQFFNPGRAAAPAPGKVSDRIEVQQDSPGAGDRAGNNLLLRGKSLLLSAPQSNFREHSGAGFLAVLQPDSDGRWREVHRLLKPGGGALGDQFGRPVADERFVMLGAPRVDLLGGRTNSGKVYVFDAPAGTDPKSWTLVQQLTAPWAKGREYFGAYLALNSDRLAVSADWNRDAQGAVHLFKLTDDRWKVEKSFTHPFVGNASSKVQFGFGGLALEGDVLAVASRKSESSPLDDIGTVSIFERNEGGEDNWGLVAHLTAPVQVADQRFGTGLIFEGGERLIAGSPYDPNESGGIGACYVIARAGATWEVVSRIAAPESEAFGFGHGLTVTGDRLFVGSFGNAGGNPVTKKNGAVYEYRREPGNPVEWQFVRKIEPAEPRSAFGYRLHANAEFLAIGKPECQSPRPLCGGATLIPLE